MKQANLYNELVRFYYRSRRKLQRLILAGKNLRKQDILQRRIVRLFRTLTGMQRALKLGTAAAAFSAGMLLFQPHAAQAQTISFGDISDNPFGVIVDLGSNTIPAFADLDADGDIDLIVWKKDAFDYYGDFFYYENTGTSTAPAYGTKKLLIGYYFENSSRCTPALADLDGDGDMDLMTAFNGNLIYFENTGTASAHEYPLTEINPFGLPDPGHYNSPAFADLDGDGDIDLMAKGGASYYYFQNTGTSLAPAFAAPLLNPFDLTSVGSSIAFADLDGDGDIDMLLGESSGNFSYLQNTGTATAPAFAALQSNPFGLGDTDTGVSPAVADLDADGDQDMMIGSSGGQLSYYENTGTTAEPTFQATAAQVNPLGLSVSRIQITPTFADLDGDGDIDMMVGGRWGHFGYYECIGTATAPEFAPVVEDTFGLVYNYESYYFFTAPSFADLDADGDMDMIVGSSYGYFLYYQNIGTFASPAFDAPQNNPFGLTGIDYGSTPALIDLDGDGDMDLMAGQSDGNFLYYQNTGTTVAPAFAAPQTNPFGLNDIDGDSAPAFADLDKDGDMDMISGDHHGDFHYYKNTGTFAAPAFATAQTNPFDLINVGSYSKPAFADLDGDGDMDLMSQGYRYANNYSSTFYYFENITTESSPCPVPANLSVANITSSSAKLKWDAVPDAQKYKLRYKITGSSTWTTITNISSTSKKISGLTSNTSYTYEVKSVCSANPIVSSDWSSKQTFTTGLFRVDDESLPRISFQIYPNPAEDHATTQFTLPQSSHVSIKVYDVCGNEIATLLDAELQQGNHSLQFSMNKFSKGVYMLQMISNTGIENQKLIVQ